MFLDPLRYALKYLNDLKCSYMLLNLLLFDKIEYGTVIS